MGRGLSELQKNILVKAYQNRLTHEADTQELMRLREGRPLSWGLGRIQDDLHSWEAMIVFFGCVPFTRWRANVEKSASGRVLNRWGNHRVSMVSTGRERYKSASASVNRAFIRLDKRGLVEHPCQGLSIAKDLYRLSNMNIHI